MSVVYKYTSFNFIIFKVAVLGYDKKNFFNVISSEMSTIS